MVDTSHALLTILAVNLAVNLSEAPVNSRSTGRSFESLNWRSKPTDVVSHESQPSRPSGREPQTRGGNHRATGREKPSAAIREGRRIYFGNMPYRAREHDVTTFLALANHIFTAIDISIDPFSGRNPSYCFVEFETKEQADHAMEDLNGRDFLGRPVKIKPCIPKDDRQKSDFVFDRWERKDASEHFKGYTQTGRRLRVSGLPKPSSQVYMNQKLREFFKNYHVEAISKTVCPHYAGHRAPETPHYAYVDFITAEQAEAVIWALNGTVGPWGTVLTLSKAERDWK
ncbi:hypothetical protein BDW59DRAFT_157844 [Aspergillus cavernicola]|uniref:RRM domain-containing protein n=1 Tax=Aspergillus cavernicola TaxID=176166 RepID=A0ABR4IUS6_9EURO